MEEKKKYTLAERLGLRAQDIVNEYQALFDHQRDQSIMAHIKMTLLNLKNQVETLLNSMSIAQEKARLKDSERVKAIQQKAERFKGEGLEEMKSDEERVRFKVDIEEREEEIQRMKEMTRRLKDYDWKEELKSIESIVQKKLTSLLKIPRPKVRKVAEERKMEDGVCSRVDESDHLFQLEQRTKYVYVFTIPQRELNKVSLDIVLP